MRKPRLGTGEARALCEGSPFTLPPLLLLYVSLPIVKPPAPWCDLPRSSAKTAALAVSSGNGDVGRPDPATLKSDANGQGLLEALNSRLKEGRLRLFLAGFPLFL